MPQARRRRAAELRSAAADTIFFFAEAGYRITPNSGQRCFLAAALASGESILYADAAPHYYFCHERRRRAADAAAAPRRRHAAGRVFFSPAAFAHAMMASSPAISTPPLGAPLPANKYHLSWHFYARLMMTAARREAGGADARRRADGGAVSPCRAARH